jgi:hypothetical protein
MASPLPRELYRATGQFFNQTGISLDFSRHTDRLTVMGI